MAGYGWEEYDVRSGGRQVIRDQGNKIDITTEFVKVEGGTDGRSCSFVCANLAYAWIQVVTGP